jgi:hypothetical protein
MGIVKAHSGEGEKLIGTQGWREFLGERQLLLAEYAVARTRAASRPMKTEPGVVAEAVFRRWLARFLPARYGVTSGFIVSSGRSDAEPLKHFDVIIFDALNAPVLWRTDNPDQSSQGSVLAIPVEHVLAVLEIKASLNAKQARAAKSKLAELTPLLSGVDKDDEPYPVYLPRAFVCATVFFTVDPAAEYEAKALTPLAELSAELPRSCYAGGIVLAAAADSTDYAAAAIRLFDSSTPTQADIGPGRQRLLAGDPLSDSVPAGDRHRSVRLVWSPSAFALFAHDLVAMLRGTYQHEAFSSRHGLPYPTPETGPAALFPLDTPRSDGVTPA